MADPSPLASVLIDKKLVNMPPRMSQASAPVLAARTAYGEARGDPESAPAVLDVIVNRMLNGRWGDPQQVVFGKNQFSAWNPNDPNREKMMNLPMTDPTYDALKNLALQMLVGHEVRQTPTVNAEFYHAARDPRTGQPFQPNWDMSKLDRIGRVGQHIFYNRREQ